MISTKWPRIYPPSIRSGESFISYSITFEYLKLYLIITLLATSLEAIRIKVKVWNQYPRDQKHLKFKDTCTIAMMRLELMFE